MIENKGDLISRSALRKAFKNHPLCNDVWLQYSREIIDNAPTVEPQNEWGKWVISEIRCPNCLEYFDTDCYSTGELNKCPNCGAEMKGGAE